MIIHKKKILVTGCHGMLGSNLAKLLIKKKYNYFGVHKTKKYSYSKNEFYLDLINKKKVKNFINKISPNIVIHTAGLVNLENCEKFKKKSYEKNILILKNLISCLTKKQTYFIYISSDQVYGKCKKAFENTNNLKPLNTYGKHKLICENLVKKNFTNFIILRTNIFGLNYYNKEKGFANWLLNSIEKKKDLTAYSNYFFHPINAYYFGEIILKLLKLKFTGLINVGSEYKISKYNFIKIFLKIFHVKNFRLISTKAPKNFFKIRSQILNLNTNKLQEWGIKIPTIEKSIKLLKKQFYENKSI